jgi:hypothetical protein|nr:MAG TPA: hypothetical protein [Caudoviricetes sp.]
MKKLSVDTMKKYMKTKEVPKYVKVHYEFDGAEFDVEVRTSLSCAEQSAFISRVLAGCFDDSGNFRPEYFDPMFHATVLQMMTNVPPIPIRGAAGDDGEKLLDIDAMDELYDALSLESDESTDDFCGFIWYLYGLCDNAAEYRRARNLANNGVTGDLSAIVSGARRFVESLVDKVDSVDTEELLAYAGKLSELTHGVDAEGVADAMLRLYKAEESE